MGKNKSKRTKRIGNSSSINASAFEKNHTFEDYYCFKVRDMTVVKELDANVHAIGYSIEGKLAKQLAGNEKSIRDNAFRRVKKYLVKQSKQPDGGFEREDMIRLWKGLFYCMWMSDKPLVHEELASKMSRVMSSLHNNKTSCMYFESFLVTINREWHGIDKWRMDKFLLLIRFMLEQTLVFLKKNSWNEDLVTWLVSTLKKGPLSPLTPSPAADRGSPIGVRLHFLDIYLAELTKCGHDSLSTEQVLLFLQPICDIACRSSVNSIANYSIQHVLQEIVNQSDVVLNLVSEQVNLEEIEKLQYDYSAIGSYLLQSINHSDAVEVNRDRVTEIIKKFKDVAEDHLPLGDVPDFLNEEDNIKEFEDDLAEQWMEETKSEIKKRKESKRQKSKEFFERRRMERKNKTKKIDSTLPYQNVDYKDVDFDAIAAECGDIEESEKSDEPAKKKIKQKKKNKGTTKPEKVDIDSFVPIEDTSMNPKPVSVSSKSNKNTKSKLKQMMEDLVEVPTDFAITATKKRASTRRQKRIELNRALRDKLFSDDAPDISETIKETDKKDESFVQFKAASPKSTFLKKAIKKVEKTPKTPATPPKKEVTQIVKTPKRVVFELSKTQIQAFKKNDRSCVLSPSPAVIPFDPNRTPDFGLLKPGKASRKSPAKRKRPRASDFF